MVQSYNENDPREIFFNYLFSHTCSRKQAEIFLMRKKFNEPEKLLREAEYAGLIDDKAFADLFAFGHLHWGDLKIFHELALRGIDKKNINIALKNIPDERTRARKLYNDWKNYLDIKKIIARLRSRGFSNNSLRSIYNNGSDINF